MSKFFENFLYFCRSADRERSETSDRERSETSDRERSETSDRERSETSKDSTTDIAPVID